MKVLISSAVCAFKFLCFNFNIKILRAKFLSVLVKITRTYFKTEFFYVCLEIRNSTGHTIVLSVVKTVFPVHIEP